MCHFWIVRVACALFQNFIVQLYFVKPWTRIVRFTDNFEFRSKYYLHSFWVCSVLCVLCWAVYMCRQQNKCHGPLLRSSNGMAVYVLLCGKLNLLKNDRELHIRHTHILSHSTQPNCPRPPSPISYETRNCSETSILNLSLSLSLRDVWCDWNGGRKKWLSSDDQLCIWRRLWFEQWQMLCAALNMFIETYAWDGTIIALKHWIIRCRCWLCFL